MVTGDAFAREFVALDVKLQSSLASTLQRARTRRRTRTLEYFSLVKDPLREPFSVREVIQRDKLREIDISLPREFAIEVIDLFWLRLYALHRNSPY